MEALSRHPSHGREKSIYPPPRIHVSRLSDGKDGMGMVEARPQSFDWDKERAIADKDRVHAKDLKVAARLHEKAARLKVKQAHLKSQIPVIEEKFNRKIVAHQSKVQRLHEICKDLESAKLARVRELEEDIRALEHEAIEYER